MKVHKIALVCFLIGLAIPVLSFVSLGGQAASWRLADIGDIHLALPGMCETVLDTPEGEGAWYIGDELDPEMAFVVLNAKDLKPEAWGDDLIAALRSIISPPQWSIPTSYTAFRKNTWAFIDPYFGNSRMESEEMVTWGDRQVKVYHFAAEDGPAIGMLALPDDLSGYFFIFYAKNQYGEDIVHQVATFIRFNEPTQLPSPDFLEKTEPPNCESSRVDENQTPVQWASASAPEPDVPELTEKEDQDAEIVRLKKVIEDKKRLVEETERRLADANAEYRQKIEALETEIQRLKNDYAEKEKAFQKEIAALTAEPGIVEPPVIPTESVTRILSKSDEAGHEKTAAPSERSMEIIPIEFKKGLRDWNNKIYSGKVKLIDNALKITRTHRRGSSYLERSFPAKPHTVMVFSANIKADGIQKGGKPYDRGKFQAIIYENGINISEQDWYWPGDDCEGTTEWTPKTFNVIDMSGSETVVLRIGLQNASGSIWIKDLKLTYISDTK